MNILERSGVKGFMNFSEFQISEISRCAIDFPYFCSKYVQINGNPFILRPYQIELYEHLEENNHSIFSKYRVGGFTTVLLLYGLWKCLFRLNENVCYLSCSPSGILIKNVIKDLPKWMTGNVLKMMHDTLKSFPETDSVMHFYINPVDIQMIEPITLLIIDEASFMLSMDYHWQRFQPLVEDGKCIISSNMNSANDWFHTFREESKIKMNKFSIFYTDYKDNEAYDMEWEQTERYRNVNFDLDYGQKINIKEPEVKQKQEIRTIWDEWSVSCNEY